MSYILGKNPNRAFRAASNWQFCADESVSCNLLLIVRELFPGIWFIFCQWFRLWRSRSKRWSRSWSWGYILWFRLWRSRSRICTTCKLPSRHNAPVQWNVFARLSIFKYAWLKPIWLKPPLYFHKGGFFMWWDLMKWSNCFSCSKWVFIARWRFNTPKATSSSVKQHY